MNIRHIWFLLAALAALIFPLRAAQAVPPAQSPWLASVSYSGGMLGGTSFLFRSVPEFIVYANGTAVWPETVRQSVTGTGQRVTWRIGTVSPAALTQFKALVAANKFLTIEPQPVPEGAGPHMMVTDGTTTTLAVQMGGQKRIVSEYALESAVQMGKDPAYIKAVTDTRDAILALKPAQSTVYQPSHIRVGVFEAHGNVPAGVPWPLDTPLVVTQNQQWLLLSGAQAKTVMDLLMQSAYVTSGGQTYDVVWAPNIDIPARIVKD